ncbi:MAG TPA: ubiquinol-cytochrome c reductase iron-sulfur subunit [bacterium]|nr:ubiquinol-cytochrome c reductase iron-sulfur subunit [bacterium]
MAKSNPHTNEPENPQRRTFLVGAITALGGFISFILGGSGLVYFLSPAWSSKKEDWVEVGPVGNIQGTSPVKMDYVKRKMDGWEVIESPGSVWMVNKGGNWIAYDPHCTHLGCPYRWDESKGLFLCPCHNGVFNKDGVVMSGPPPRPLRQFPVKLENGTLYIIPEEKVS